VENAIQTFECEESVLHPVAKNCLSEREKEMLTLLHCIFG
jgi:hypothetical protein